MKDSTKSYLAFAAVVLLVVAGALVFAAKRGGDGTKKATPEQNLQTFLAANATKKVASITVVSCTDAGQQTVNNVTYSKLYACPTQVALKDGSGGCVGILFAYGSNDAVVVADAPATIDPKYCAAGG